MGGCGSDPTPGFFDRLTPAIWRELFIKRKPLAGRVVQKKPSGNDADRENLFR